MKISFSGITSKVKCFQRGAWGAKEPSPNQVLTHAARAAAKQLNQPLCGRARRARRALVSSPNHVLTHAARAAASQLNKHL